jgi:endoglucanase
MEKLFVDLRLPAREVKENVSVGDPVSLYREADAGDGAFTAPYLDDRLGVYTLLEALRRANTKAEIAAVVSVQEEVGTRGAQTSAFGLDPDLGVALDVSIADDLPGMKEDQRVCEMGAGVALSIMDSYSISDHRLVQSFKELAERNNIPYQLDILLGGGTDAAAIQLSRAGVPVITVGAPVRYVHTVNETAAVSDIEATSDLLVAFLEGAGDLELGW